MEEENVLVCLVQELPGHLKARYKVQLSTGKLS